VALLIPPTAAIITYRGNFVTTTATPSEMLFLVERFGGESEV
jgi:hypothetical protein